MQNTQRLRNRIGQDHARLSPAGPQRHSCGWAGVEGRRQRRRRTPGRVLQRGDRACGGAAGCDRWRSLRSRPASTAFPPIARRGSPSARPCRRSARKNTGSIAWCSAAFRTRRRTITRRRSTSVGWCSSRVPDAVQRVTQWSGTISAFTRVFDALWLIRDRREGGVQYGPGSAAHRFALRAHAAPHPGHKRLHLRIDVEPHDQTRQRR